MGKIISKDGPAAGIAEIAGARPSGHAAESHDLGVRRMRLLTAVYGCDYINDPANYSQARRTAIVKGELCPSLLELLTGTEFRLDDIVKDVQHLCKITLKYERPIRKYFATEGLSGREQPDRDAVVDELLRELKDACALGGTFSIRRIHELLLTFKGAVDRDMYDTVFGWPEFEGRLTFYLACVYDQGAQARVARLCLDVIMAGSAGRRGLHALSCCLGWLRRSRKKSSGDPLSGPEIYIEGRSILARVGAQVRVEEVATIFLHDAGALKGMIDTLGSPGLTKAGVSSALKEGGERYLAAPNAVVFQKSLRHAHNASLSESDQKLYGGLAGKPMPLVQPSNIAKARSDLVREFPWAESVIDVILLDAANRRNEWGVQYIKTRPLLLVGLPGIAKTSLALRFAEIMGLPRLFFSCGGIHDSQFGASNKKWSNSAPALPVERIAFENVANMLIILDEIDKSGTRTDNGRLQDVVLTMVEPRTASEYFDQYLSSTVDLSYLNWICTANSLSSLSPAFCDRFHVLHVPKPTHEHLSALLPPILRELSRERHGHERWIAPLNLENVEKIEKFWTTGSIRDLKRMVLTIVDDLERHMPNVVN